MFLLNGGPKPQSEGCCIYVRLHWRLSSTVKSAKPEQRGPLCVEGGRLYQQLSCQGMFKFQHEAELVCGFSSGKRVPFFWFLSFCFFQKFMNVDLQYLAHRTFKDTKVWISITWENRLLLTISSHLLMWMLVLEQKTNGKETPNLD